MNDHQRPPWASRKLIAILSCLSVAATACEGGWDRFNEKPASWYRSEEAKAIAANVLVWQSERGDWPNDVDSSEPYDPDRDRPTGTFDDEHTTGDVRFLTKMYQATGRKAFRQAILEAIDLILTAQYPNGGFPQSAEPGDGYDRYITFNDNAMVDVLRLLRDIATEEAFSFVGAERREAAEKAFEKGVACILRCQVVLDGRLTIWAQQHDEVTLEPRPARSFEPAALAAAESAGVLRLLMRLKNPSAEVVRAVESGVAWFRKHQLDGIRLVRGDHDVWIESDSNAPPLWARFYDLEREQPIFADREGQVHVSLDEIGRERRTGYAWYGRWGRDVLERYEQWSQRIRRGGPTSSKN